MKKKIKRKFHHTSHQTHNTHPATDRAPLLPPSLHSTIDKNFIFFLWLWHYADFLWRNSSYLKYVSLSTLEVWQWCMHLLEEIFSILSKYPEYWRKKNSSATFCVLFFPSNHHHRRSSSTMTALANGWRTEIFFSLCIMAGADCIFQTSTRQNSNKNQQIFLHNSLNCIKHTLLILFNAI